MRFRNISVVGAILSACLAWSAFAGPKLQVGEVNGQYATQVQQPAAMAQQLAGITNYLMVGGEDFGPARTPGDYEISFGGGGACMYSGANALSAGIHLPQGAVITGFKVFFSDNTTSDVSVTLQADYPAGGYYFNMATLDSSGISGLGNKSTTTIAYPSTIDNTTFSYSVRAYSSAWNCSVRVMGVLITYMT